MEILCHGTHGMNYLRHRNGKNYLSTYLENRNSVITGSLISQIKVWHCEDSKGCFQWFQKGKASCSTEVRETWSVLKVTGFKVHQFRGLQSSLMTDDFHAWGDWLLWEGRSSFSWKREEPYRQVFVLEPRHFLEKQLEHLSWVLK